MSDSGLSSEVLKLRQKLLNSKSPEEVIEEFMQQLKHDSESKAESTESSYFDAENLNKLICALLSDQEDLRLSIHSFGRFLKYNDVMYFTIRSLYKLIKDRKQQQPDGAISAEYSLNTATLMTSIKLPNFKLSNAHEQLAKIKSFCSTSGFRFRYDMVAKMFSSTWTTFLSFSNCFEAYKKVLAVMDSQILPHYKDPLSLADFLISCYNLGGSVALLSLSSLFLLMTKYNLEYPDFFNNFYRLISPEILHVKYRSRFFYWTDIFLSSTNLPAYLVAAFIKKLSRLALIASIDALIVLIPLIGNLLVRHPNLHVMANRTQPNNTKYDPFDFEATDPKLSNAIQSSLWEMKSLQKHWNGKVREAAKFINGPIPKEEWDLSDLLETSLVDLIEEAFNKELPDVDIELSQSMKEELLAAF